MSPYCRIDQIRRSWHPPAHCLHQSCSFVFNCQGRSFNLKLPTETDCCRKILTLIEVMSGCYARLLRRLQASVLTRLSKLLVFRPVAYGIMESMKQLRVEADIVRQWKHDKQALAKKHVLFLSRALIEDVKSETLSFHAAANSCDASPGVT